MTTTQFPLHELLETPIPTIKVVDVGALPLEGVPAAYARLFELGICELIGFEPAGDACQKLNQQFGPPHKFLPYFIGSGRKAEFRLCNFPMTSSLFEPNSELLIKFQNLEELTRVVERSDIQTQRLDDLPELEGMDYLKMDVQGAELEVIEGATETLKNTVVVETEVEFVPMYQNQPLFAEVDQAMRRNGFIFHRFRGIAGRPFKPWLKDNNPNQPLSQYLWADAIYIKDFTRLSELTSEQLLKAAIVLHEVYQSIDLVHHCLVAYDQSNGANFAQKYLERIISPAQNAA